MYEPWSEKRTETLEKLEEMADYMDRKHKHTNYATCKIFHFAIAKKVILHI